jgi:hypothetical protein
MLLVEKKWNELVRSENLPKERLMMTNSMSTNPCRLDQIIKTIGDYHWIRKNELAVECYKMVTKAYKIEYKKASNAALFYNTVPYICCFTGQVSKMRVRFYLRDSSVLVSPWYTIHSLWCTFIESLIWISSFETYVSQQLKENYIDNDFFYNNNNNPITISTLTEDILPGYVILNQCLEYIIKFVNKFNHIEKIIIDPS